MGVLVNYYGSQKAIFANQDDGIFSAIPITFDESVLTLETAVINNRRYVKAGSVVKQGTTIKGITAEEYDITDGPVNGRVVLEGYVYVQNLTEGAVSAMSTLPKIVPIPYGKIVFSLVEAQGTKALIQVSGSVWATAVAAANISVEATGITASVSSVTRKSNDDSLLEVEFTITKATSSDVVDGEISIKSVAAAAVVGSSGKVISGLPIKLQVKNLEVCE